MSSDGLPCLQLTKKLFAACFPAIVFFAVAVNSQPAQAQTFTTLYKFPAGAKGTSAYDIVVAPDGCGMVFELTPTGGGNGTFQVLHQFDGTDGWAPQGLVVHNGAIYGATAYTGTTGPGTLFEIVP